MEKNILIVDDVMFNIEFEEIIIKSLVKKLKIDTINIDTAYTMTEAIEKITENKYDAMFIDMNLPDGSGVDVAKFARKKDPDTRIAALTIYPSIFEKERANFDLFLKKPIMPNIYEQNFIRLLQL